MVQYVCVQSLLSDSLGDFVSIVISESTRNALECVLHCNYSGKKTDKI